MRDGEQLTDTGAERALLATIIADNSALRLRGTLSGDDFGDAHLGGIFEEMLELSHFPPLSTPLAGIVCRRLPPGFQTKKALQHPS